jgi:hypothetical protein
MSISRRRREAEYAVTPKTPTAVSSRAIRARLAPNATQIASSRYPDMFLASSTFATFAQTMIRILLELA